MSSNTDLMPPEQFQIEKPPCIRAAMMEHVVAEINKDFGDKLGIILDEFTNKAGVDRPTAFMIAYQQLNKKLEPYILMAETIMNPYRTTLSNAQELERLGKVEGAIALYEKLVEAGFTASMPYERLRILYTKNKDFSKAIIACQSFIAMLETLESMFFHPSNVKLIETYKSHIDKLRLKMNKIIDGKLL